LSKHVRNAYRHQGRYGVSVRKETPNSPDKIDGCVSMIGVRILWRAVKSNVPQEQSNQAMFLNRNRRR
ncbi:terminase, partial [Nocardia sp. NPDC059154]